MYRLVFSLMACVTLLCGIAYAIPTNGLIAYYPFTGSAADESGNANNGTVHGATLTSDRFGNANHAYYFDGVDDYIDMGNSSLFNITQSITMSVWIRPNTLSEWSYVISKAQPCNSAANYNLLTSQDRTLLYYWDGVAADKLYATEPQMEANSWYHIAMVYNYSTFEAHIYINGSLTNASWSTSAIQSGTWSNGPSPSNPAPVLTTNDLSVGATLVYYNAGRCEDCEVGDPFAAFNGIIDDVAIYGRVLSASEIQELYSPVNPIPEPCTMLLIASGLVGVAGLRRKVKG